MIARGGGARLGGRAARREPRPRDLAGEAQLVQPRGRVVLDAARRATRLPGGRRRLEALELDRLTHAARPSSLRPFGFERRPAAAATEVLPAQQEAHVVLRRDRVDLAAQPVEGVAVDAREQPAVAALLVVRREPGVKRPRSTKPPASSMAQAAVDVDLARGRCASRGRQRVTGRAPPLAAQQAAARVVAVVDAQRRAPRGSGERALDGAVAVEQRRRGPESPRRTRGARESTAPSASSRGPARRSASRCSSHGRAHAASRTATRLEQRVVDLLGVARARARPPRARARWRRVEGAELARVSRAGARRRVTARVRRSSRGASSR